MSSAFQVYGLLIKIKQDFRYFANENALSANERKKRAKFLLMNKAFVTLLIRSFRGGQATIAHYFYAISYYIIAVTGGGCFERTEISFIPFQGRIQRSAAITYPFEEQPDSTWQIYRRGRRCSLQGDFSQEKKVQNQIYLNKKRPPTRCKRSLLIKT